MKSYHNHQQQIGKKSKIQFSTRFSGYLGEHQCQDFFEKVNITRQTGTVTRNKNAFNQLKKPSGFKQTLQLHVPFIADLSDDKKLCICYPVHFFRRKAQSFETEIVRLASLRVYFPASNMRYGNNLKVSVDLKKRYHISPHEFEMVAYSSLLTLTLEDLALAIFRAKSLSEKFKLNHSMAIPKILCHSYNNSNQLGSPIFLATQSFYNRVCKFISMSQYKQYPIDDYTGSEIGETNSYYEFIKLTLKWLGIDDFLPESSRLVFVRRVSSDNGDTFSCSILNSPGPKLRRSKVKESDQPLVRLKQGKQPNIKEGPELEEELSTNSEGGSRKGTSRQSSLLDSIAHRVARNKASIIGGRLLNAKRPRGRPKKPVKLDNCEEIDNICRSINIKYLKKESNVNKQDSDKNDETSSTKNESCRTNQSVTDSTSEEKYSFQHSSPCSSPQETNNEQCTISKSQQPSLSLSSSSASNASSSKNNKKIKNKRGRPRKFPLSSTITSSELTPASDNSNTSHINSDTSLKSESQDNCSVNTSTISTIVTPLLFKQEDNISQINNQNSNYEQFEPKEKKIKLESNVIGKQNYNIQMLCKLESMPHNFSNKAQPHHSIWRPLKQPLLHPYPCNVPLTKPLSSTGLKTDRQINISTQPSNRPEHYLNCINAELTETIFKTTATNPTKLLPPLMVDTIKFPQVAPPQVLSSPLPKQTSTASVGIYNNYNSIQSPLFYHHNHHLNYHNNHSFSTPFHIKSTPASQQQFSIYNTPTAVAATASLLANRHSISDSFNPSSTPNILWKY